MALTVVFACGGTGGHISPALALAQTIRRREPDANLRFIGSERGLERTQVQAAGFPIDLVPSRQVLGRGALGTVAGVFAAARGTVRALSLLREARPALVIGVGGYASVPTVVAARLRGIPIVLLEPDALSGRANRLLARFARRIFVQFDAALEDLPQGRGLLTGLPVRELPRQADAGATSDCHLLITGGSQGARSLNRAMAAALPTLVSSAKLRITHQTGAAHVDEVRDAYRAAGVEAEVAAFFDDLPARIASADLVVARAGANTCAELCLTHTPSILVPYPFAANDHQTANARDLERAGACVLIPDSELEARLADEILALVCNPEQRREMAESAAARSHPDAAERIWAECSTLIEEAGR